jgi:hypothetical protein
VHNNILGDRPVAWQKEEGVAAFLWTVFSIAGALSHAVLFENAPFVKASLLNKAFNVWPNSI